MDWLFLSPLQYWTYISLWVLFCVVAANVVIADRKKFAAEIADYIPFLFMRWKLLVLLPAFLFVTFAGRFTDDDSWDVVCGFGMSTLTFLTAPYALGIFYQVIKGTRARRYAIVALALGLFSSSWFYDSYLLLRDGEYSTRWLGNLILSPTVYICAGLLWNLEAKSGGGFRLSFMRAHWPKLPRDRSFLPLLPVMLPIMLIVAVMLIGFVSWRV